MLQIAPGVRVYLACRPVDMRRGFDGLSADVAQVLKADPFSGRGFSREAHQVQEKRIWASLPSSLRIAWKGVLKPRHFLGARLAVMTMSWISSSDRRSMSM